MKSCPPVSVLLPVFNAGRFLEACLASLSCQTFSDFEVVAVDDGSTDSSPETLRNWALRDPRIRVLTTAHSGLVHALNAGLHCARGRLIARMDADDVCSPERLEIQHRALTERPWIDVLGSRVTHFSSSTVGRGFRIYERWLNDLIDDSQIRRDLFIESPLAHPSVMFRRRRILDLGGYQNRNWPEDYDLWLRLAADRAVFSKVDQDLLAWRDHPARLTRTDGRYAVERFIECKAHYLAQGPLLDRKRVIVWGAGRTGRRLSKHLLQRRVPLVAFVDIDPRKCGRTLRRIPIIDPDRLERMSSLGERRPLVLAAVSSRGARAKIRHHLDSRDWYETHDYWCVA